MKLWILGAEGLLGKALLKQCALQHICAVGTGKTQGDITCKEQMAAQAAEIRPTHIINCAAYTDVDKAQSEYDKAFLINALGAQNGAEIARAAGAGFIHISTDFVFDDSCARPYREDDDPRPVNAYGQSKWEGEQRVFFQYPDACVIRTSWLFGDGGKNFFSSLIASLQKKEEVHAVHDQWGCVTYAADLAAAILDLLDCQGTFHYAQPHPTTRFEVALFALEAMRKAGCLVACKQIVEVSKDAFSAPAPRPTHSILSTEKYTQTTGKHCRAWQEAVEEFVHDAM
jgi:dTDP-4-dehydrorhamnose reductase